MKRREFIVATGALLATARAAAQEAGRHYRVGVLCPFQVDGGAAFLAAIRETLAAQGFVEGRNLTIEARTGYWSAAVGEEQARALLASKPDVIYSLTMILTRAAQAATKDVPIVFAWVADPAALGVVQNYARPEGNTTGVSNRWYQLWDKRLELLRELVPGAKRVAVLAGLFDAALQAALRLAEPVVERLGFELIHRESQGEWTGAMRSLAKEAQAIFVATPFSQFGLGDAARTVVREAAALRIPTVYADPESVELGGLMSYVANPTEGVRRGAGYVARILQGAKPGDLPIDQAARFELLVNVKAAKDIGLTIPSSILLRADKVIE